MDVSKKQLASMLKKGLRRSSDLHAVKGYFEKHSDEELCQFERVNSKYTKRADLYALTLLESKFPDQASNILARAEYEKVWLSTGLEEIGQLSERDVITLLRCGVHFDWKYDQLAMYV